MWRCICIHLILFKCGVLHRLFSSGLPQPSFDRRNSTPHFFITPFFLLLGVGQGTYTGTHTGSPNDDTYRTTNQSRISAPRTWCELVCPQIGIRPLKHLPPLSERIYRHAIIEAYFTHSEPRFLCRSFRHTTQ